MASRRPMFYLIDGHAVAYRQYFGLPVTAFTTSDGEPTNAVYGFTRILLDIILKERPDYLAVSFDEGLSGREEIYSEYKGTREKMPEELSVQMPRIRQIAEAFNIPVLSLEGYEADDIIGTVTAQIAEEAPDVQFRIITGDRDLLQLLSENVTVALPRRDGPDEVYDVALFKEKYGLRPDQLVDMKALMGDSSDNIPGVKGIGEKGATSLLQTYDTLDAIYADIESIKGANRKKLETGRELAYISQDLARIRRDVPIHLTLSHCRTHEFDRETVLELFRELEFRSFKDRLQQNEAPQQMSMFPDDNIATKPVESIADTVIVDDEAKLTALAETLAGAEALVWDVETTSVDPMQADLVGVALAVDDVTGYYIPVGHDNGQQLPLKTVIDAIRPALTDNNIPKYAHNAAYDLVVMARYGVDVAPVTFDSMVAEWLINPISKFLGLKAFADQYLKIHMTPIEDLIGKGKKQKPMSEVAIEQAAPYAAADAVITRKAVDHLQPQLEENNLTELYQTLEMPLVPVIAEMEQAGIALDTAFLREMSIRLDERIREIEREIFDLSGGYGEFNISSPKQLNDVLFGKLSLPVDGLRKTTHGYSTDAATLEGLKNAHPIITAILDYRELTKLKGTYVDALPELVNPKTGRIHTSYNQTGTSTGRLSSNNPNLQNIPIRTEIGREVRRAFIADAGHVLLGVDYSQIELRVLAHISQDETLLEAFAQDQDIHRATAAAVNRIALEDVTYEQRSFAKRVNFGLIYGMGAFRLARDSELTRPEAERFIETYFERLPNVRKYIKDTENQARDQGYVSTLFGRKRHFPALQSQRTSGNHNAIESEKRAAINMPIQGTAADIMKKAMIDVHIALRDSGLGATMTLQVHDELVFEVPEAELAATCDLVVRVMEAAYPMDAPLKANAQSGYNWRDMADL